jgi:DUF1680 family protein
MDGSDIHIIQQTEYPKNGIVRLQVSLQQDRSFTLALRIPSWCMKALLTVNGQLLDVEVCFFDS